MPDFCLQFPATVTGEELEEAFRELAEEELERYDVEILAEELLDVEGTAERLEENPEDRQEMEQAAARDRKRFDQLKKEPFYSLSTPELGSEFLDMFDYKDGLKVEVRLEQAGLQGWWERWVSEPLAIRFEIDPERDYTTINDAYRNEEYDEEEIEQFASFASLLADELGTGDVMLSEKIYCGEDADDYHFKSASVPV
jgi:hypothetical protein